jgi:3-carboxy-cis,cis-muconate cycloisomerase
MKLYDELFRPGPAAAAFSEQHCVQRMLDFEAALARAEARCGLFPAEAAEAIAAECRHEDFHCEGLARAAALAGNIAIPLVRQLTAHVAQRNETAARYVHYGATSQDAIDTATMLQTRDALDAMLAMLSEAVNTLARLTDAHRSTPLAAHTWMQQALPTTLGFIFAGWLDALLRNRATLERLRSDGLALQFGGAAGTLAALQKDGMRVAKELAKELKLPLPIIPWHTHRERVAEIASAMATLTGTLGKMARDLSLHMQTETGEMAEPSAPGRGGSSAMPHKRNPVLCAQLLAAAERVPALAGTIFAAMVQEQQRALGGWQAEWETLAEIAQLAGGALWSFSRVLPEIEIEPARMKANLDATNGLIFAEAASNALRGRMGGAAAHRKMESLSERSRQERKHLAEVMRTDAEVRALLSDAEIDSLFRWENYLGSSQEFIERVLQEARRPRRETA